MYWTSTAVYATLVSKNFFFRLSESKMWLGRTVYSVSVLRPNLAFKKGKL